MFAWGDLTGHAIVRGGGSDGTPEETIPLSSRLQDGAVVMQRTPAGFTKEVFDAFARHFASFSMSLYLGEITVLSLDGKKVYLSQLGLRLLLEAGVHVIIDLSKLLDLSQSLDSPGAFKRFQPVLRAAVERRGSTCSLEKRVLASWTLWSVLGRRPTRHFPAWRDGTFLSLRGCGRWT